MKSTGCSCPFVDSIQEVSHDVGVSESGQHFRDKPVTKPQIVHLSREKTTKTREENTCHLVILSSGHLVRRSAPSAGIGLLCFLQGSACWSHGRGLDRLDRLGESSIAARVGALISRRREHESGPGRRGPKGHFISFYQFVRTLYTSVHYDLL